VGESATTTETLDGLREEVAALRARVADLEADAEARKDVLTIDDAARVLSVSRRTIERRIKDGSLPHFRIGSDRCVRIERAALLDAARRDFRKLSPGRSRLWSKPHHPGSKSARSG